MSAEQPLTPPHQVGMRPFLAEITHRDGTQNTKTAWATDKDTARSLLRAPDTVVRILDENHPNPNLTPAA